MKIIFKYPSSIKLSPKSLQGILQANFENEIIVGSTSECKTKNPISYRFVEGEAFQSRIASTTNIISIEFELRSDFVNREALVADIIKLFENECGFPTNSIMLDTVQETVAAPQLK
ncbi:MAG: hypothetical protein EPN84_03225 [Legionella sp.]|nr:MAG: hypothetical protein EPN84_03225 [Legionella sp.]